MNQTGTKQVDLTKGLRWLLLFNAISTGAFGFVLLLFGPFVGEIAGLDHSSAIRLTGFGLLVFISFVYWASRQRVMSANMLLVFAFIDLIWVVDSILLVSFLNLTLIGLIGTLLVAMLVAVFSIFEFYYYRTRY
ncbi:hypothetical protein [Shimazuella kribbensis]|uniref:hypothetical protein n=1 Tax=Shimazuella kribbensis TaxID=139808 RepID=UPI000403F38D|nr:hypothetical protein [Shimazuella kribbensis]